MKRIFKNLEIQKSLKTVKYNNNIKKWLNINFNDVIEYLEKYSPIELEIKPVNNESCKFINIKKEDEIYYHIYFNISKKEIKRNYIKNDEKIKLIKIIIDYQIISFENLFYCCDFIESIYFNNNKQEIKRNYIFSNEQIKLIKIIIDYQVKSLEKLFRSCGCIESIYFKKFSRNNINNMEYMFYECSSLKELNLNNFNTNKVTDMGVCSMDVHH